MSQSELIYFKMFDVKTMANSVSGSTQGFKDASKLEFLLWLLSEIKTLTAGNVMRKKEEQSVFQFHFFPRLSCLRSTHLLLHSSARAGHLVRGFNETG